MKLRRDLEDQSMQHEANTASLRKKHQDAANDLADQLDQVQKARQKYVNWYTFNCQWRTTPQFLEELFTELIYYGCSRRRIY